MSTIIMDESYLLLMANASEQMEVNKYLNSLPHMLVEIAPRLRARERLGVMLRASQLPGS